MLLVAGNYDLGATFDDESSATVATIKTKNRRVMLTQVETKLVEVLSRKFTVNIPTPQIGAGANVKINDR